MTRPEIIVYRDGVGDIFISLDGGATNTQLTLDGEPWMVHGQRYMWVEGPVSETEVWRSGDKS